MFFARLVLMAAVLLALPFASNANPWKATDRNTARMAEISGGRKITEGFFGAVALGYLGNTGNTRGNSLNALISAGYLTGPWRHIGAFKAIYAASADATTAEEYDVTEQTDYAFGEKSYVFGALDYNTNRFGPYRRRASEVVGYGQRVLEASAHTLDIQTGIGARQTRELDGSDREETIVTLTGKYDWNISQDSNFSQRVSVEGGPDNTYTESVTALKVKIEGNLALSVSFTVKHNTDVPPERTNTDTTTAASVIYQF